MAEVDPLGKKQSRTGLCTSVITMAPSKRGLKLTVS